MMRDREPFVGEALPRPSPFRPDKSRRVRYERAFYHEVWEPFMHEVWKPLAGGAVRFWRGLPSWRERWGVAITLALCVLLVVMLIADFRTMPSVR